MLVGGASGDLFLVDIAGKTPFVSKYKGCAGAVKSIACPDDNNLVFTVSLDRHFRIYDFQTRKLLYKVKSYKYLLGKYQ
jgi:WD40 repeat protein